MAAETKPVSRKTRQNLAASKRRRTSAISKAPAAPTAPASVGVKKPV